MPQLVKIMRKEDWRRRAHGTPKVDLGPYQAILADLPVGAGAEVARAEAEQQRVVKRRFSMAAAQQGVAMKWHTAAEAGHLRFEVIIPKNGQIKADRAQE